MRIEDLQTSERDGLVERSVRLSWIGGETRTSIRVPAEYAAHADDMSPFVPVALLNAMRRAEPLLVDGPVSRRLLDSLVEAQELVSAWNPSLARVPVRAAAEASEPEPAGNRACFFSRGIDSMYSAAVERRPGEELTHLVFWADMEVRYGDATRPLEIERAREAARRIGLELVVATSDVQRPLTGVLNFDDATSALLAAVGLSLPGLSGTFVVPSSFGFADMTHQGTHPMLDPLWSTHSVRLVHDSCIPDRARKVEWLVRRRPDLLPFLHACAELDDVDNCGRCGKCLWSMLLLEAYGGLEQATSFPGEIDMEVLRGTRRSLVHQLLSWDTVHRVLPPGPKHDELRQAVIEILRASGRRPKGVKLSIVSFDTRRLDALMHGRVMEEPVLPVGTATSEVGPLDPSLPPPRDVPPGRLGLVRGVDHDAARHRYSLGGLPGGQRSGELGALLSDEPPDGVALGLDGDGVPVVELPQAAPRPAAAARWTLAPMRWPGVRPGSRRLRESVRRGPTALAALRNGRVARPAVSRAWLHRAPGPGRLALWAARHPVLDDVLLTTDEHEAPRLGYGQPALLGHLEALAPVTGALGPAEVEIPWARLWGWRELESR